LADRAIRGPRATEETLVFLERPADRAEREVMAGRLAELLPAAASAPGGWGRPLFRVTREGSARVVEALGRHRLPARAVPATQRWRRLPGPYATMVAAVSVAGLGAGLTAMPLLLWTTPLMGGLLLAAASRELRTPLVAPVAVARELPPALESLAVRTLAELPPGTARSLLADVVRLARPLFARLARAADDRGQPAVLGELVTSACAAAADLAMLDDGLARFERERARAASPSQDWLDALGRSERARDALVQRLLEAMAVLGRLQSQATWAASEEEGTLAEVTRELQAEAAAQAAAAAEIARLLGPAS
jgi:hypothetical protein